MTHSAEIIEEAEVPNVRILMIQTSFSNPGIIPPMIRQIKDETPEQRDIRTFRFSGNPIIEPTENCSLVNFVGDIGDAGYELVDAFYQRRIPQEESKDNQEKSKDKMGRYFGVVNTQELRMYHTLRFVFARQDFAKPSPKFQESRNEIMPALMGICDIALWRVRAFNNPYFQDGREITGQRAISINLEHREPLFYPNGERIMVYPVNEAGEKIRDFKVPIEPAHYLYLEPGDKGAVILRMERELQMAQAQA